MLVAITYHEDFAKSGFSVLKERIRPSWEKLMESGLVDGVDVQVFLPKPVPLRLVERAHTPEHMANMQSDPYRNVALLSAGSVMMAAEMVASGKAKADLCLYRDCRAPCLAGEAAGVFAISTDVAIAILRLREMGLERFLIIDVDPHFGDGTRDFFGDDPNVFHINLHSGQR